MEQRAGNESHSAEGGGPVKHLPSTICIALLAVAGCKPPPPVGPFTPSPEMKGGHPVVHVPPVETRLFEDGYNAGYEYGRKKATPHGKLATDEEARQVARERSAGQP